MSDGGASGATRSSQLSNLLGREQQSVATMLRRKKVVEPAEPSEDLSSVVLAAAEQALTDCGNFRLSELLSLPDNLRFLRAFCVADGCFELALFVLDAQHACSAPVPSVCDTCLLYTSPSPRD